MPDIDLRAGSDRGHLAEWGIAPDFRILAVRCPSPGTRLPTLVQPKDLRPYRVPPLWTDAGVRATTVRRATQ